MESMIGAIDTVIRQARTEKPHSNASVRRLLKALHVLGFVDQVNLYYALSAFDVCRPDGTPYGDKIKRIW